MGGLIDFLRDNFEQFDAVAGVEVFIIWLGIFWLLMLLRGTTAMAGMYFYRLEVDGQRFGQKVILAR